MVIPCFYGILPECMLLGSVIGCRLCVHSHNNRSGHSPDAVQGPLYYISFTVPMKPTCSNLAVYLGGGGGGA